MSLNERLSIALPTQLSYTVVPDKGSDTDASYADITFTNNDSNQVFKNLTIDGYCLDAESPLSAGVEYTANVYSSYEQLPDSLTYQGSGPNEGVIFNPDSLDIINWIINQNFEGRELSGLGTVTSGDVQTAIWSLIDDGGTAGQLGPVDQDRVDEIVSLAQSNGVGFSPSYDYENYFGEQVTGKMAVILAPEDNNGDGLSDAQILIAEVELSKLGDRVWLDEDADGIQDAGEEGISGVTVNLLADVDGDGQIEDGEVIDTTTTDADGNYDFEVIAGDYKVQFEQPDGLEVSPENQGGDDSLDSDGLISDTVTLDPGEEDLTIDAGFYELGSIGDTIYRDDDADGTQDAGENGIAGVTVKLTDIGADGQFGTADDVVIGTETNADGEYLFEGLNAGNYQVEVTDENNVLDGLNQTADPDNILDNASMVTLSEGESNLDQDFGYAPTGSIGDTIFRDNNGDGDQDAGEAGIANVTVKLTDKGADGQFGTADDTVIGTKTTDANGKYLFEGLDAGNYQVSVTDENNALNLLNQTADPDGTLDDGSMVTLSEGESNLDQDFGYAPTGSIGNRIFRDNNGDGNQDTGEAGIAGVTVKLTDKGADGQFGTADDVVIGTKTTNAKGKYRFNGLDAGNYQVEVTDENNALNGLNQTADPDGILDNASMVTLAQGENNLDQDFGYAPTGSIGDTIFRDNNGDGDQDAGEAGIANVTVKLTDKGADGQFGTADDTVIGTKTTDANGKYLFEGLDAGNYQVSVTDENNALNLLNQTADPDGTLDDGSMVTLSEGESNLDQDFGYAPTGSIGNRIFRDNNGDGNQDTGEAGIAGVTVKLTDKGADGQFGTADDVVIGTKTTNAKGKYRFNGLDAGNYQVEVTDENNALNGLNQTADPDGILDNASMVTLAQGENNLDQDFGYQPANPGIDIEKFVNGEDADTAAEAVEIAAGDDAIFTYEVTNTGNVSFAANEVVVVDDNGTAGDTSDDFNPDRVLQNGFNVGDANQNNALDSGETWKYSKTLTAEDLSTTTTTTTNHVIDFDGFAAGTVIDDEYASLGVNISATGGSNQAMIFDSANPTGGDNDLRTPGNGINNTTPQGNILIISEDGDSSDPDDNARGGTITFDFDDGVNINSLSFVDIEENGGKVFTTDANGNVTTTAIPGVGDNSFQTLSINDDDVVKLEVDLTGSGSISSLDFDRLEVNTTPGLYTNIGTVTAGNVSDADAANYVNPDPITGYTYEAEDLQLHNYTVEHVGDFASGGEVIKLTAHEGSATVNFDGVTGNYDIVVGYYDENDGQSHAQVKIDGHVEASWTFNQDLGSNVASADNFVQYAIDDVNIEHGSDISLWASREHNEFGRFDYVAIVDKSTITAAQEGVQDELLLVQINQDIRILLKTDR